jgi:bifunctional ADP-heptose synthase (sugar kinase/adenylyltransferase)
VVPDCQLVIFSDFNYGCLPYTLIENLTKLGQECGGMMVADRQSSSQLGDVSRFKDMHLLTTTEHEARVNLRNHQDGLVVLAEELSIESGTRNVIMESGLEGALLQFEGSKGEPAAGRIPALNPSPRDTVGAGAVFLVTSAMAMAVDLSPWEVAYLGSIAAAVQTSRIGNRPLPHSDLVWEFQLSPIS